MTWRLALKPQADRDINNHFEYIAKDNLDAATRFYEATFRAFDVLMANPKIDSGRVKERRVDSSFLPPILFRRVGVKDATVHRPHIVACKQQ
jgi:plasmid stabilization system protein ParE